VPVDVVDRAPLSASVARTVGWPPDQLSAVSIVASASATIATRRCACRSRRPAGATRPAIRDMLYHSLKLRHEKRSETA